LYIIIIIKQDLDTRHHKQKPRIHPEIQPELIGLASMAMYGSGIGDYTKAPPTILIAQ